MLIPLTRKTFETLVPTIATGAQYLYCWGKISDFLRRLLISVVSVVLVTLVLGSVLTDESGLALIRLLLSITAAFYWLWAPVLLASLRNIECRRYAYSGFLRGEVLDTYITEELIGKEETVNNQGELVIVENRERCLNLEVGDETGFSTRLQVPLKREHQAVRRGDRVEMVVLSNRGDLGRINKTSDFYIPDHNVWVSDYPYLQREAFVEISRRLSARGDDEQPRRGSRRRETEREPGRRTSEYREDRDREERYQGNRDREDRDNEASWEPRSSRNRYADDRQDSYRKDNPSRRRSSRRKANG